MKIILAIALSVALAAPAAAQANLSKPAEGSGTLAATGKVVNPANVPQAGVPVRVQGPLGQTFAVTDNDGNWALYNLPAGTYEVKPPANASSAGQVTFTVKERGFWEKLTGSNSGVRSEAYFKAPDMTLGKDWVK